jgi:arsenite-transporting ATPase
MRILLFTGKGGVGKTSIAAATAYLAAKKGYKTLVMSTDPAHSLADSFDVKLGGEPIRIAKNLYGEEINPQKKIEENWGAVKDWLIALFSATSDSIDEVVAEELSVLPGMDELFSLIEIKKYYENKKYDFLIVDCAPTGATLRLLSFPDVAGWYMRKIFPIEKKIAKMVFPVAQRLTKIPLPTQDVYKSFEAIYERAGLMSNILGNEKVTSVRLVVNPEKMVIKEAHRGYTYLSLFGLPVDMVIVNRVLPDDINDPYFIHWKKLQKDYLKLIEESFNPLPIYHAKLFNKEVVGLMLLESLGKVIYNSEDPTKIFFKERPIQIKKDKGTYEMLVKLPFVAKKDLDLKQVGDELIIGLGLVKRTIALPDTIVDKDVISAEFKGNDLLIKFK